MHFRFSAMPNLNQSPESCHMLLNIEIEIIQIFLTAYD